MSDSAPGGGSDRRTAVRVRTEGAFAAQLSLDVDSDVQTLSSGGMSVRLEIPLEPGSRHLFTLALDDRSLDVSAIVRNCQPSAGAGGAPRYDVGLEFEGLDLAARDLLERFVARKLRA